MKQYQDNDILHGHVDPMLLRAKRQKMGAPKKKGGAQRHVGIFAALIALITPRKAARNR